MDCFADDHSYCCEVNVLIDWVCMSLLISDVQHFSMTFFWLKEKKEKKEKTKCV